MSLPRPPSIIRYVGRCRYPTGRECAAKGALPNATTYLATSAGQDEDLLTLPRYV